MSNTDFRYQFLAKPLVHIKKVEILGFKSFGFTNTIVQFRPGLVSISGPNGSGKSNILDAIIFAMGENKPRIMRAERLRSLIHDVDEGRRTSKVARTSVHFDNSDRKIPVDSDAVVITREMDETSESTYFLNKKKVSRGNILNLLDMAHAGLSQLNAVQQGTVTRISEMTSDEKRVVIEDMLGLTSFDQRKEEAKKNLDEADRKLEIRYAKMGELKKQLQKLETERTEKLRHDMLQKELVHYRAIAAAGRLETLLEAKSSAAERLRAATSQKDELEGKRTILSSEIDKVVSEKTSLMDRADEYNKAQAVIEQGLRDALNEKQAAESIITISSRRTGRIESRLEQIGTEALEAESEHASLQERLRQAEQSVAAINERKDRVAKEQEEAAARHKKALDDQARAAAEKDKVNEELNDLHGQLSAARFGIEQAGSRMADAKTALESNRKKLDERRQHIASMKGLIKRLDVVTKNHADSISQLESRLEGLHSKRKKTADGIEELETLLEKSSNAANQYESKIKTVRKFMYEDYTVARLKEDADKLGIRGLVYEIITWDKKYDRAVLAAGSDWLKAMVVDDLETLLGVAEFARTKKLPKLKMIPLDALPDIRPVLPKAKGAMGILSNYVHCSPEYSALKTFLFGGIILADSVEHARGMSRAGYKAVTPDGEFFEARGGTVVIDINSRISKIARLISMSTDIEGLFSSISLIKKYRVRKKHALARIDSSIEDHAKRLNMSKQNLTAGKADRSYLESSIESATGTVARLESRNRELATRAASFESEVPRLKSQIESINDKIKKIEEDWAGSMQRDAVAPLQKANAEKFEIDQEHARIMGEFRNAMSRINILEDQAKINRTHIDRLKSEKESLQNEAGDLASKILSNTRIKEEKEEVLAGLRQKEQDLISSTGYSTGILKRYDDQERDLRADEKDLTKRITALVRESDSLGRDIERMEEEETVLQSQIPSTGVQHAEDFDAAAMIRELEDEIRSLPELNAKGPESYLILSEEYHNLSPRRAALERERNGILEFIEKIERDKKQKFLDGFDTVDREIRHIFAKMTGGNAWLEIQNEDDIFSSGISYLIQFPKKPKRESTSISGGEKTLAAVVFVLGLQKLQPSPFYLFDEVDAHLDALNAERLANILDERARESQFIMVSLKDSVVEKADLIYGVYTKKNGISAVVTYNDKKLADSPTLG